MSFINRLANNNLLENVKINENLIVGNQINTKNIIISDRITILPDAEIEGSFLETFTEPLDENTNEEISLYEKLHELIIRYRLTLYNMRITHPLYRHAILRGNLIHFLQHASILT